MVLPHFSRNDAIFGFSRFEFASKFSIFTAASFRSAQQFRNINKQKVTRNAKANSVSLKTFEPKFEMILLKNVFQKDSNVK